MRPNFQNNIAGWAWKPGDMSQAIRWDFDLVDWSFDQPWYLGFPVRFLAAFLGPILYAVPNIYALPWWGWIALLPLLPLASNRLEPMPAGKNTERLANMPAVVRWYWWHLRNPWEDAKKYFLGFGYGKDAHEVWWGDHFRWWMVEFTSVPFRIPFPYWKRVGEKVDVRIGWKSRGILSVTVRGS